MYDYSHSKAAARGGGGGGGGSKVGISTAKHSMIVPTGFAVNHQKKRLIDSYTIDLCINNRTSSPNLTPPLSSPHHDHDPPTDLHPLRSPCDPRTPPPPPPPQIPPPPPPSPIPHRISLRPHNRDFSPAIIIITTTNHHHQHRPASLVRRHLGRPHPRARNRMLDLFHLRNPPSAPADALPATRSPSSMPRPPGSHSAPAGHDAPDHHRVSERELAAAHRRGRGGSVGAAEGGFQRHGAR